MSKKIDGTCFLGGVFESRLGTHNQNYVSFSIGPPDFDTQMSNGQQRGRAHFAPFRKQASNI